MFKYLFHTQLLTSLNYMRTYYQFNFGPRFFNEKYMTWTMKELVVPVSHPKCEIGTTNFHYVKNILSMKFSVSSLDMLCLR